MKLTVDLINDSITHINPLKDRELVLRSRYTDIITMLCARRHDLCCRGICDLVE